MWALMNDRQAAPAANAVIHAGFVLAGIVTTLLGPILPILIARWAMSDEHAGLFFTMQFIGNIAGILSLSFLITRRGYGVTLAIGFGFIAIGIAALNSGNEVAALGAAALYGYGLGLTLSGTNLWVADVAGPNRASALNIANLAWGIGAIVCPGLVLLAYRGGWFSIFLFGVAGFAALIAASLALMDIEPACARNSGQARFRSQSQSADSDRRGVGSADIFVHRDGNFAQWVDCCVRQTNGHERGQPLGTRADAVLGRSSLGSRTGARRSSPDAREIRAACWDSVCGNLQRSVAVGLNVPRSRAVDNFERLRTREHLSAAGCQPSSALRREDEACSERNVSFRGVRRGDDAVGRGVCLHANRKFKGRIGVAAGFLRRYGRTSAALDGLAAMTRI